MLQMGLPSFTENENIVQENNYKVTQVGTHNVIHHGLKCSRGIRQSEAHNTELVVTERSFNCSLRYIFLINPDLVVPRMQVQLGEIGASLYGVEQIVNIRKTGLVLYCYSFLITMIIIIIFILYVLSFINFSYLLFLFFVFIIIFCSLFFILYFLHCLLLCLLFLSYN